MSLTDQSIIDMALLARLAVRPGGDHERAIQPGRVHHARIEALAAAGRVRIDAGGVAHLTQLGWYHLGGHRQARIWHEAVTEHACRQGPIDAPGLRRLVLEHVSALQAYRRMAAAGQPAAAASVWDEAQLILARLAVVTGVPVHRMWDETVLLKAESLAVLLDQQTEASHGNPASVDPRQRMESRGLPSPGDIHHDPWLVTAGPMAGALLES